MNSLNFIPTLTENNFTEAISKEINPVFVIFKTDWYGTTYIMAPILEEIDRNFAGKVSFFTFNYDENKTYLPLNPFNYSSLSIQASFDFTLPVEDASVCRHTVHLNLTLSDKRLTGFAAAVQTVEGSFFSYTFED